MRLPELSLPQALQLLAELSGLDLRDVERDPTYASEVAAMRCIDARNTIRAAKNARKNGRI